MNRAFKESFVPILGLLGLLFLLLLYVRYQVGLDADEATVITVQASVGEEAESGLLEEVPELLLTDDKQARKIFTLIMSRKWQQAESLVKPMTEVRNDALVWSLFGILRYKQGKYDEALSFLDRAAKMTPVWPTLFFYRALVHTRLDNFDAATDDYRRVMQFNENHFEAHYNLGLLLIRKKKFSEAVALFERASALAGGARKARAYYQLGRAWTEQGAEFYEQASVNFNLAVRHLPGFIEPRLALAKLQPNTEQGRESAEKQLQEVLELDAGNPSTLFALAQLEAANDNIISALARYRKLLQYAPDHMAGRYNLALLLLKEKRWLEARDNFDRVIESNPQNVTALFNRGRANYRLEEYALAIEDYQKALALKNGDYPETLLNLGLVYVSLKDFKAAEQSYRKALSLRDDYPSAWYNLGLLFMRQDKSDEALNAFDRAVSLRENYVQAWYNLGVIYGRKGQNEKSIFAYKTALKIRPEYTKAQLNLAVRLVRTGQPLEAIAHYRKALELDATYSSAWYNMALAHMELKQYEEAEQAVRRMLALEPDSLNARLLLADTLSALGRSADAVDVLEEAVDIESNSPVLRLALAKSLRELNKLERARREVYKGLALEPENKALHEELRLLEARLNTKSEARK